MSKHRMTIQQLEQNPKHAHSAFSTAEQLQRTTYKSNFHNLDKFSKQLEGYDSQFKDNFPKKKKLKFRPLIQTISEQEESALDIKRNIFEEYDKRNKKEQNGIMSDIEKENRSRLTNTYQKLPQMGRENGREWKTGSKKQTAEIVKRLFAKEPKNLELEYRKKKFFQIFQKK